MALNATTLKSLMKSKIASVNFEDGDKNNDDLLQALAEAIVDHIQTSGQVAVTSGSSSGVYPIL